MATYDDEEKARQEGIILLLEDRYSEECGQGVMAILESSGKVIQWGTVVCVKYFLKAHGIQINSVEITSRRKIWEIRQ